jgi:superfamily II DNA or RNA helicase
VSDPGQISDFRTLLSTLSPDALTRGKQFERVTKWWLENDPIHSRQIEKVWLWDEWPEYPGRDIGIDLVARLIDGSLMAVQAKCVHESRLIPKSELDSFVSAASTSTFKHKMLVATTDGLSANAQRMLTDQHVVRVMLSDLQASLDVWPSSIDHLDQRPVQPKATPRPHQQQAISGVTTGMRDHDRGQLIMACGTGKTLTALWITEQLKPAVTLVLVPSLNLLSQTLSEWAKNTTSEWSYLCVCSDDTVNKSDDQAISTVDELPFEVTTNPDDIAIFLTHSGTRIIFSTYQSSARVAQAQQLTGTTFNLVICDEAHRLTGKTEADYATVLDNSKIVAEKRLFMTATPRTYTPAAKSKAEDRGVDITSMDDETVYGPVLHKLSFGEAIKQELLSDYRVLIVGVTDPQVQELIDRREIVSVNDTVTTDARTLAAHIGLAKATKDYNLKRTISFHSRIKSAGQFAQDHIKILDWLPDTHKPSGVTWTGTISGAMNTGERRRLLTQLKQDDQDRHALLTNARCLTEGVDVPSLDGVAFIDPRSSQVDIIQAVGRAIRKSANKEIGTIVLPVLIPTDADAEHALEDTAFKPIWAILNALKSHDEELAVELNNLRTELGRTGKVEQLPDRLVEDLPADIDSILPGFSYKLSIAILQHSTTSWEWWFGLLLQHASQTGNAYVAKSQSFRGAKLGTWVAHQRENYQSQRLSHDRIQRLEELPNWSWDLFSDQWKTMYALLLEHVKAHGTSRLPRSFVLSDGTRLGLWVSVQRKPKVRATQSDERRKLLEAIRDWTWDPFDTEWEETFSAMLAYSIRTGSSRTPSGYQENGFGIDHWATNQRRQYKDGELSTDRIERLSKLPDWSWDPLNDDWDFFFNSLKKYADEHPEKPLPPKDLKLTNGKLLYSWASNQKNRFNMGKLTRERIEQLETIPGWVWSGELFKNNWILGYESLKEFAQKNSHFNSGETKILGLGTSLSEWIQTQKSSYKDNTLSQERVQLLEALPGWSWVFRDTLLDQAITQLNAFLKTFGHLDVPNRYITSDGYRLGAWVSQKRVRYKKGELSDDVIAALETLNEWAWISSFDKRVLPQGMIKLHSNNWNTKYEAAKHFCDQFGHCSFPKTLFEGENLTRWASYQRKAYSDSRLSTERIRALEELEGWSWKPKGGPRKLSP